MVARVTTRSRVRTASSVAVLGLNIGRDFDTKIVVKINAVERLRADLRKSRW